MGNKITINVTQSDIDSGIERSTIACPIALAIGRHFPESTVSVGAGWGRVYTPEKSRFFGLLKTPAKFLMVPLPNQASRFIINYDSYGPDEFTKPFTFEAEVEERKQR